MHLPPLKSNDLLKNSTLIKYLGVAQSGQSAWFGTKLSKVRIFPPRPNNRTKAFPFNMSIFIPKCLGSISILCVPLGNDGDSPYSKRSMLYDLWISRETSANEIRFLGYAHQYFFTLLSSIG